MRRRRATPSQPLLNNATSRMTAMVAPGKDRGAPPPPRPVSDAARLFVYRNMLAGASLTQMVESDAGAKPPDVPFGAEIIERAYRKYIDQLRDLARAPEQDVEAMRALQVERVQRDLYMLRLKLGDPKITNVEYARLDARVTAKEDLLADLAGTRKPIDVKVGVDVDVRVRSASMRIVSELTAEQLAEMGRDLARAAG